jgi:hypothetical protein
MDRYNNHTLDQLRDIRETKENSGIYCSTTHECVYVDQDSKGRVTEVKKYSRFGEVIDQDETINCHISPAKGGWEVHIYDTYNGSDVLRTFKRKWECQKFSTFVAKNILYRYKML